MKQVTVSFTPEEYVELAKLLQAGLYFIWDADDYPNEELAEELMTKICTNGYVQLPESGAFEVGAGIDLREPEFEVSEELNSECRELDEAYTKRRMLEFLSCELADRDFFERYGEMETEEIVENRDFVEFILGRQNIYRQEFLFNSVHNLVLKEK